MEKYLRITSVYQGTYTLLDNTASGLTDRQIESQNTRQAWTWRQEIRKLKIILNCMSVAD